MSQSQVKPTVIFLHIPKAAGTTLHGLIWRHYSESEIYTIDNVKQKPQDLAVLSPQQKARLRMITGHINYGVHTLLSQPATYITILREPIDLVISNYHYIKRAADHPLHARVNKENMTLIKFLESKLDENMSNTQTRFLAGKALSGRFYDCSQSDLEVAKKRLKESFSVIGLTEAFDETLILLQKMLGWHNLYYAQMNVTPNRTQSQALSTSEIEKIIQVNLLDIELYQYATQLFQEQINSAGQSFNKELKSFQLKNYLLYPLIYIHWYGRRRIILAYRRNSHYIHSLRDRLSFH